MKPNRNSNPNLRPHPAIARLLSLLTDRAAALRRDPAVVAETIGYSVQPFHREWLQFQQDNPRTLLLAPRGHGKSSIAGIAFAIWKILRQPDVRILIASNTHDQARVFLREIRNHLECPAITALFGKLRDSRWNDTELIVRRGRIMKEATLTAAGANGSVVGRHFDVIIGDDIVDEENSWCEPQRAKLINWFHKVLFPCLEPGGEIHLIGTRYHEADLYGSIIQKTETETESGRRGEWESGRKEEGRDDGMAGRPEENEEAESGGVGDGESGREEHRKARMRQGSHAPGRSSHPSTSSTGSASSTMSTARHSSFIVHRSPSSPPLSPSPTPPLSPSSPRSAEDPASATPPTHPPASRRSPAPNEPHRVPAVRKSLLIGVHPTTPSATPSPTSTADTSAPGPGSPTPSLPHPTSSALRTPPSSLPLPPSPTPPLSSSPWRVLQHSAILPSGQPLWPGKYPLHELESFRREMGDILFSCQFLNDPRGGDSGIFKESWLQFYETLPLEQDANGAYRHADLRIFQGVDLAISQKSSADYFAVVTIGVDHSHNVYVLDTFHGRLTFDKQMHKIRDLADRFHPLRIAIESNAFQDALPAELARTSALPVRRVRQKRDKLTRAVCLSPQFENGKIFLKRSMAELIGELLLFPRARHDDLFDALELAVNESINTATIEAGLY